VSEDDRQARLDAAIRQHDAKLDHERELAAARGEEYTVPYDLGFTYSAGAPEVELYWHRSDAFVAFYLNNDFDEIGLLQFVGCWQLMLGPTGSDSPAFAEHRLFGKGLRWWRPHRVVNSTWIGPSARETFEHYLFAFHDEMLEAVADDVIVSKWDIPMRELMKRVAAGEIDGSRR